MTARRFAVRNVHLHVFFINVMAFSQYTTVKVWIPLANFVLHHGQKAVDALDNLERYASVTANPLRKLGAVADMRLTDDVIDCMTKPKASLGDVVTSIGRDARRQWYHWHIHHPQLPVHHDRSMHLSLMGIARTCICTFFLGKNVHLHVLNARTCICTFFMMTTWCHLFHRECCRGHQTDAAAPQGQHCVHQPATNKPSSQ